MRVSLFERASKNFKTYLNEFKMGKANYGLPKGRLTEKEWYRLNSLLSEEGVALVPSGNNRLIFCFIKDLYKLISKNFESYIVSFKKDHVAYAIPKGKASDMDLEQLNFILAPEGVALKCLDDERVMLTSVEYNKEYEFDKGIAEIMPQYNMVEHHGSVAYICDISGMGGGHAQMIASELVRTGKYYADVLNKEGYSGADHIVIALPKKDAEILGYTYNEKENILERKFAAVDAVGRIIKNVGKPLDYIGGAPIKIESAADYGVVSGRSVLLVKVGDRKIPFYISTGSAGKTDVPTGRWEFFGGFQGTWFRKGTLGEISNHYSSLQLKEIAKALDFRIGDLRDTQDVLKSIGRKYLGGVGCVAKMIDAPVIARERVNENVSQNNFYLYLHETCDYLKLVEQNSIKATRLYTGILKLKNNLVSKITRSVNNGSDLTE